MSAVRGYIGAAIAVGCFGSYAVPVKLFPTGDGIFFQWVQCMAIVIEGLFIELALGRPYYFEPLAMLGGMFWCLGNAMVVPIVSMIGLSLGMLLWGVVNMITGWAAGRFGIIVAKEEVAIPALNYIGVLIAVMSVLLYLPVKPTIKEQESKQEIIDSEDSALLLNNSPNTNNTPTATTPKFQQNTATAKVLGIGLSVISGLLYGINMLPVSILQDRHPHANPLAFAFSHFLGIFLTSTAIMVVYSAFKRNRPFVNPQSILPGLFAGTLWATAQAGWFIGNANLGLSVAFPIITTGPAVVASIYGIVVFKEIKGTKNLLFLAGAFTATLTGILLITFSK